MESRCPDCGALTSEKDADGPIHEYMCASAGCWKIFNDVLAKKYSDRDYWKAHRMTVDAYAAQHASGSDPRQVQSVVVHLLALFLTSEKRLPEDKVRRTMEFIIAKNKDQFPILSKPKLNEILNVGDIVKAKDAGEHLQLVTEWADQVWHAWDSEHQLIKSLVRDPPLPLVTKKQRGRSFPLAMTWPDPYLRGQRAQTSRAVIDAS